MCLTYILEILLKTIPSAMSGASKIKLSGTPFATAFSYNHFQWWNYSEPKDTCHDPAGQHKNGFSELFPSQNLRIADRVLCVQKVGKRHSTREFMQT